MTKSADPASAPSQRVAARSPLNEALDQLLRMLGWSAGDLGRAVNRILGPSQAIHGSTPYTWVRRGSIPRPAVREAVRAVLSDALGRDVDQRDIWPSLPAPSHAADQGSGTLRMPWVAESLPAVVQALPTGGTQYRPLVTGSGAGEVVRQYQGAEPGRWRAALAGRHAPDEALVRHMEAVIPRLRELDDADPGEYLTLVDGQVRAVTRLVSQGRADSVRARRLLGCLGHLAQLAGWTALELGTQRSAQGYLLLALRAARGAGDAPLGAHVLADLSYQAAVFGRPGDAVTFGGAADRAARGAAPLERASVVGRVGYAWAAAGEERAYREARDRAASTWHRGEGCADGWAYYLTEQHLTAQAGYALVALGRRRHGEGGVRAARLLVREGRDLLACAGSEGYGGGPPNPRKAGFELGWAGVAHSVVGDLESACAAGARALVYHTAAPSARTQRVLRDLRDVLAHRLRSPVVREFLPHLEGALSSCP